MVDKLLLGKYVNGLASDGEAELCEKYLLAEDNAGGESVAVSALDTACEQDSLMQSLADEGLALPESATQQRMDEYSARIQQHIQQRLAATDIAKFLRPPQSSEEIGRLGDYRLLEKIGAGGMGIVFRAAHVESGRTVALKMINPLVGASPTAAARFEREVRAAAKLDHPRIVTILDFGSDEGLPFFTMELLEGQSLGALLETRRQLCPVTVRNILLQALEGLQYAERHGIQHRDIKPDNLWVDAQGDVTILDFGLACNVDDTTGLTQSGDVLGTPRYMAPEQVTGRAIDSRTDLFSLGSVAYEMLTGQCRFADENIFSTMMAVTQVQVTVEELLDVGCPRPLAELVCRLLEKSPADRPESVGDVHAELQAMQLETQVAPQAQPAGGGGRNVAGWSWPAFAGGFFAAAASCVLAIVLYVQTDRGTLVVEAEDGVQVTTGERQIKVRLIDSDREYTVRLGENRLPSGAYEILIGQGDGVEFSSATFAIHRGGQRVVKLSALPPGRQIGAAGPDAVVAGSQQPQLGHDHSDPELSRLEQLLRRLYAACKQHRADTGVWPEQLSALLQRPADWGEKPWPGPFISDAAVPKDDWGFEIRCVVLGGEFNLWSPGPDGVYETNDDTYHSHLGSYGIFAPPNSPADIDVPHSEGSPAGEPTAAANLEHLPELALREGLGLDAREPISGQALVTSADGPWGETRFHRCRIRDMSLSAGGDLLAVGGDDAVVRVWQWHPRMRGQDLPANEIPSIATMPIEDKDHQLRFVLPCRYPVEKLTWSPQADVLAVAARDPASGVGHVLLWKVGESHSALLHRIPIPCDELSFNWDGTCLALQMESGVRILRLAAAKPELAPNFGLAGSITRKAWSPDGRQLVVTRQTGDSGAEPEVIVWNVDRAEIVHRFANSRDAGFVLDADGTHLIALRSANEFRLVDCDLFDAILVDPINSKRWRHFFASHWNGYVLQKTEAPADLPRDEVLEMHRPPTLESSHRWGEPCGIRVATGQGRTLPERFPFAFDRYGRYSAAWDARLLQSESLEPGMRRWKAHCVSADAKAFVEIQYDWAPTEADVGESKVLTSLTYVEAGIEGAAIPFHRATAIMDQGTGNILPEHVAIHPGKKFVTVAEFVNVDAGSEGGSDTNRRERGRQIFLFGFNDGGDISRRALPLDNGKRLPRLHWSPSGNYLVAHDVASGKLEIFKPQDPEFHVQLKKEPGRRGAVNISMNERIILCDNPKDCVVWKNRNGEISVIRLETGEKMASWNAELDVAVEERERSRDSRTTPPFAISGFAWHDGLQRLAVAGGPRNWQDWSFCGGSRGCGRGRR